MIVTFHHVASKKKKNKTSRDGAHIKALLNTKNSKGS